jgi:hypothetical protein
MNEIINMEKKDNNLFFCDQVDNDEPSFPEQMKNEANEDYRLFCVYMSTAPGRTIKKAWENSPENDHVSRAVFNRIAKRHNWASRAHEYDVAVAKYLASRKVAMIDLANLEITTGVIEASLIALRRVFEILQLPLSSTTKISDANELIKTILLVHSKFLEGNGQASINNDPSLLLETVLKISQKRMINLNEIPTS